MVTAQGHPLFPPTTQCQYSYYYFHHSCDEVEKNLRKWKTLEIQMQLLQSITHVYEMMFCNKSMELQTHALMHANVNTQLVETRKNCVYFFFQSKLNGVSTWAPNWEYSSEHNGAYGLAASHPITSIILTLLLQYVLWNRPGAKEDLSESLDIHQEIRQGLREEETLGLARWEMEEYCKQKEQPECRLWGRKIFSEQKASQSDWDTGNKEGWCQVEAAFYKVFGFRTLLQSNWKSLKNLQEVNQRFRFVFQSSLCCVWRLLLLNHSVVSDLCDLMVSHHAPLFMGFSGKNTWVGGHFLLQGDAFWHILGWYSHFLLFTCISASLGH